MECMNANIFGMSMDPSAVFLAGGADKRLTSWSGLGLLEFKFDRKFEKPE